MADLHPENPYAKERFPDPNKRVEFSDEAKQRFDYILTRYPNKEAALLPVLHLAQEVWGWISPEVVVYVGELLDLAPATVFGVVSFYNMYNQRPVGKYHLQVCTNLSCMVTRAYDIYEHLCEKLDVQPGQTTRDGLYTVTEVECLGSCGTAPVVQINNDYHENMDVAKMDALLTRLK
ncbi:MAG: NAD(P)H-dependent oxidoreductase subunit E [Acidobacteria bacterium]|nr:NAD(P)H-dependent oxidoreductase subunit E [Acidobacteriota bacterium]MBV9474731.1 NAD(P)H-dependent oxidoreductase subunit E [Acidobacteriota bacterium]